MPILLIIAIVAALIYLLIPDGDRLGKVAELSKWCALIAFFAWCFGR